MRVLCNIECVLIFAGLKENCIHNNKIIAIITCSWIVARVSLHSITLGSGTWRVKLGEWNLGMRLVYCSLGDC